MQNPEKIAKKYAKNLLETSVCTCVNKKKFEKHLMAKENEGRKAGNSCDQGHRSMEIMPVAKVFFLRRFIKLKRNSLFLSTSPPHTHTFFCFVVVIDVCVGAQG